MIPGGWSGGFICVFPLSFPVRKEYDKDRPEVSEVSEKSLLHDMREERLREILELRNPCSSGQKTELSVRP